MRADWAVKHLRNSFVPGSRGRIPFPLDPEFGIRSREVQQEADNETIAFPMVRASGLRSDYYVLDGSCESGVAEG
jgi:hypothetical protein